MSDDVEQQLQTLATAIEELGTNQVALAMALLDKGMITEQQLDTYKLQAAEAIRTALSQ